MDKRAILQLSSTTFHPLPPKSIEKGGFSKDGRVIWMWSQDNGVNIYKVPNTKLGFVNCEGKPVEAFGELTYNKINFFLLVFGDYLQSVVAVISQVSGQLVQVVKLPHCVTFVCGITNIVLPGLFTNSPFEHFSGVVGLGCTNGRVLLLDLSLDHLKDQPRPSMEAPRQCRVIQLKAELMMSQLHHAIEEGMQLAVNLNFQYVKRNTYHYTDSADKLVASFEGASVSTLLYVPQLCSILIGYSFGGFQIFSLLEEVLIFTYPLSTKHLPPAITHFTFQEPENDPRPFVYVWVARNGLPTQGRLGSSPSLTLYQLAFKKKMDDQGSAYYQEMEGCLQRFEHMLWPDPYSNAVMLNCYTVERSLPVVDTETSFSKSLTRHPVIDRTLAVFMCLKAKRDQEEEGDHMRVPQGLMVVFDLNQWYHSQMPVFACWSSAEQHSRKRCPFLSVYELSCDRGHILDVRTTSIFSIRSPPPVPEMHLWPESLTIRLNNLSTAGMLQCLYEGIQRRVLNNLLLFKADVMTDPERYLSLCRDADLHESIAFSSEDHQHSLLTMCLHYGLKPVLMAITKASMTPGYRLSSNSLLNWIKNTLDEQVNEKSKILDPLLSRTTVIDDFTITRTNELYHHFSILADVLIELHSSCSSLSEEELILLFNTSKVYSEVFQTAHWCMEKGLLPHALDTDPNPTCETTFVFPAAGLQDRYGAIERQRVTKGLAIDVLIGDLPLDEDAPFLYPPGDISCLMCAKVYPTTLSQQCLILYILYDIATPPGDDLYVKCYTQCFEVQREVMQLAHAIWSVDHATPTIKHAQLLSGTFPVVYQMAIQSLIDKELYHEAIQYMSIGGATCPRLHLQALINGGYVSKAFKVLAEYEGTEDYSMLLEHFVDFCLQSPNAQQMKELQLNREQLAELTGALKSRGGQKAIHLALSILLLHRCNVEAITLAREKGREGGVLGECLAYGSGLLPPVKQGLCSVDLMKKLQSTMSMPIGPPAPLSTVMAKSVENKFTSQVDIIVAVAQKVAEARFVMNEPQTPLRRHTRLESVSASPVTTVPFTSSPLPSSRKSRAQRSTLLIQSTPRTPSTFHPVQTPGKRDPALGQFLAHMQGFRTRMAMLSGQSEMEQDDIVVQTPVPVRVSHTPHPASILKPFPSLRPSPIMTPTIRKIRFAMDDDSIEVTPKKTTLAITTPLPESDPDDSEFYSPEGSPELMKDDAMDVIEVKPDIDDPAANVVIVTEGEVEGQELFGSFVASADEDEKEKEILTSSIPLSSVIKSPSDITKRHVISKLTRGSIHSSNEVTLAPKQEKQSKLMTPILSVGRTYSPDRSHVGQARNTSKTSQMRKTTGKSPTSSTKEHLTHSGVMVNIKQEEEKEYQFSPPQPIAKASPFTPSPIQPFVFSPPLLRSANKERKKVEFTRTGIESIQSKDEGNDTSFIVPTQPPSRRGQQKRIRQVKTGQSTPRRSERLLRDTKK